MSDLSVHWNQKNTFLEDSGHVTSFGLDQSFNWLIKGGTGSAGGAAGGGNLVLSSGSNLVLPVLKKTASYQLLFSDPQIIVVDATAGAVTITLPLSVATGLPGQGNGINVGVLYRIYLIATASAHTVTVAITSPDAIVGTVSTSTVGASLNVLCYGAGLWVSGT
jgi:hypothetical protein